MLSEKAADEQALLSVHVNELSWERRLWRASSSTHPFLNLWCTSKPPVEQSQGGYSTASILNPLWTCSEGVCCVGTILIRRWTRA